MTSWTQRDVHGSLYVYVRGVLVMKTWPSGRQIVFQDYGRPYNEPRKNKSKLYENVYVALNGVLLKEDDDIRFDHSR